VETLIKVLLVLGLVGGVVAAEQTYEAHLIAQGDAIGAGRVKGEWVKSEAGIKATAEREAAAETKKAHAETDALQLKFDQLADRQQKERTDHEFAKRIAVAAALAGDERLSIDTTGGSGRALPEGGAAEGAAAGADAAPAARAYLLPKSAAAVLDFAGDYGQLVRDYNSVLERFDAARASCNAE
jgi:hypothetical protein